MKRGLVFLLFCSISSLAQNSKLFVTTEIREKSIIDAGYKKLLTKDSDVLLYNTQRTRISVEYKKKSVETVISFQDIRLWGSEENYNENGVYGSTQGVDLYEAWIGFKCKDMFCKLGRQTVSLDDQRLLSARSWNDYQLCYDMLLIDYKFKKTSLKLGLSWNADNKKTLEYPSMKIKSLNFLHWSYFCNKFKGSNIALIHIKTKKDTLSEFLYGLTLGQNISFNNKRTCMKASFYYQKNLFRFENKQRAFLISSEIEYAIMLKSKLNFRLGFDYLSGQNETNISSAYKSVNHKFDLLYGKRHGFYGYMDYFSKTPTQGLQDFYCGTKTKINEKYSFEIIFHRFYLAEEAINIENKILGSEADYIIKHQYLQNLEFSLGYSFFIPGNTLKKINISGVENSKNLSCFAYFIVSYKPQIFESNLN